MSQNGLSKNGLSQNGLTAKALGYWSFSTWFNQDVAASEALMKYLVKCAASSSTTLNWTNPVTRVSYSWSGLLGLASSWTGGSSITTSEQQVITACLAAHVNKFAVPVSISVTGKKASGTVLSYTTSELTTYDFKEACFFGNLFTNEGTFVANDHAPLASNQSTARACDVEYYTGTSADCSPLVAVGDCAALCTKSSQSNPYYDSCTYNGRTYKPLTTRLQTSASIYTCGDGVCQVSESCGTSTTYNSCSDCGACP